MGRRALAIYVGLSGALMFWLGYALVDSWTELLALVPAVILVGALLGRAERLENGRSSAEQRYAKLSEQHSEMLAHLELAQLRVNAIGLMGIRVVWMSTCELEQLAERVKSGQKASPQLSKWMSARRRLAFLPMRGLNEETARVWPLDAAEAERVSRGVPWLETIVSKRAKTQFAPELTDDELSRPRA